MTPLSWLGRKTSTQTNISDLQNWGKINRTTTFHKWLFHLTPEGRHILKILWKWGEIAPREQFLLFSTIFCYLLLDFHIKTGTRFSLRDKLLLETSEVEITRVNCMFCYAHAIFSGGPYSITAVHMYICTSHTFVHPVRKIVSVCYLLKRLVYWIYILYIGI